MDDEQIKFVKMLYDAYQKSNGDLYTFWAALNPDAEIQRTSDARKVFIFCNKKRDAIKVLRYDQNGFVLATKKLLDDMKFQWPRTPDDVKEISFQQVEWLLQGLEIEQKKAHHQVKINRENTCF